MFIFAIMLVSYAALIYFLSDDAAAIFIIAPPCFISMAACRFDGAEMDAAIMMIAAAFAAL